jgi:hypothetical protein
MHAGCLLEREGWLHLALVIMHMTVVLKAANRTSASSTMPPSPLPNLDCSKCAEGASAFAIWAEPLVVAMQSPLSMS